MAGDAQRDVTTLLDGIRAGDEQAKSELFRLVYDDLRGIAHRLVPEVGVDQTQATALVNEAAIRLLGANQLEKIENRAHFFRVAAKAIRQLLVDDARRRRAVKRGGGRGRVSLSDEYPAEAQCGVDAEVWLDKALRDLESLSPRMVQVIELRRYARLSNQEIAKQLGVSLRTIENEVAAAKAWLFRELKGDSCG